jgi:hypothetical protein
MIDRARVVVGAQYSYYTVTGLILMLYCNSGCMHNNNIKSIDSEVNPVATLHPQSLTSKL